MGLQSLNEWAQAAKRDGAKILAINPLPEAGLLRFDNPQKPRGLAGSGTALADKFLKIRSNGDLALWQAIGHLLLNFGRVEDGYGRV